MKSHKDCTNCLLQRIGVDRFIDLVNSGLTSEDKIALQIHSKKRAEEQLKGIIEYYETKR